MKRVILLFYFVFFTILSSAQENCNNGIDDDGNGKIDLNDSNCVCSNTTSSNFINNYNFEQMIFCPNKFSQFNAATNWFLPSTGTSDYINSCDFIPVSALDAGIYPLPSSNGNGVAGILASQDYKEFIATCTNTRLIAGQKYQLNFDIASSTSGRTVFWNPNIGEACNNGNLNAGKIDITLYGRADCNTSTPANTNNYPPGWQPLGTATYLPSKNWNQLSIIFTPTTDVNSIMLGPPFELPDTYLKEADYFSCFPYFYFDNLILNNASNLGIKINSTGSFCENSLVLNAYTDSTLPNDYTFQWYKNGVAISGSTNSSLNINYSAGNIGNYQVKISNSTSCKISPFYNVNMITDIPEYTIEQSPCFPGTTTITISTPADEYSFDNGASWSTNPSKDGLNAYFNPIKILIKRNGCISNGRNVILTYPPLETINIPPEIIAVQPGCQTNGSITVTTPALEYSFDDGANWSTNPTISNLPPNDHHDYKVKIKTLLGCITVAKYIVMMSFRLAEPTVTSSNAGCGIGGTITITTSAKEYSINGGASWSDNAVFSNLSSNSYLVMVKNEFNCTSQVKQVFIGTDNLLKPKISFTQPDCENLGTITVTTQSTEYSFDDGVTWSSNNIATNLSSGFYHIKVKDAQQCISLAEVVYLQTYELDVDINYSTVNSSCINNGSIRFSTIAQEYSIDNGISWYANPVFLNLSSNYYYYLKVRNGINCQSKMVIVNLQDFKDISPAYQITNAGCKTYGSIEITTVADFYSFDNGINWSSNNTISNLSGNINYIILVKKNNCTSRSINVNFNSSYIPAPITSNYHAYICDINNNKTENINITDYNALLINNYSNYSFHYFTSIADALNLNISNQIQNFTNYDIASNDTPIFVTIVSSGGCFNIAEINFSFLTTPIITSVPNEVILCQNSSIIVIGDNNSYDYLWSNGETTNNILIKEPGDYSVTASYNDGHQTCSTTKNFKVILSNAAAITNIETQDWTETENLIVIHTSGFGNYEFSIDGITYQDSNVFSKINSGPYTVYVRDKNGCGISKDDLFLLMFPRFFTPNDDGYNDTWGIKFSYTEPRLTINIFDRYGKLLKTLNNTSTWDGRSNGIELPSNDYWFVVTRENGKEYRGNFTLKR